MNLFRWCILMAGILLVALLVLSCNKIGEQPATPGATTQAQWPPDTITLAYQHWPPDTLSVGAGWSGTGKSAAVHTRQVRYMAVPKPMTTMREQPMTGAGTGMKMKMAVIETTQTMLLVRWPPDTTGTK